MSSLTWQPDSAVSRCFLCHDPYTLFNRRHHCRKCGKVVCASCSAQQIRYPPNSQVISSSGYVSRAQPSQWYRTCDECVEEIRSARRAPRESTPSSVISTAKYDSRVHTRIIDSPSTSSSRPIRDTDTDSDDHLCPVCGVDLLRLFRQTTTAPGPSYDSFKEGHINECLTAFDFANDNMRLSSPPDGRTARNRMLVYNMPPIPEPKYESLEAQPLQPKEVYGSATSEGSWPEKTENECVICLDELKPGDKVGRLECLCVFHYKCIKDWFNKKSYAECPVHYMHK